MNSILVGLLVACAIGTSLAADDCTAKFEEFHKCVKGAHEKPAQDMKAKFAELKPKIEKCYTDNGCTAPAPPQKGKGASSGESSGEKTGPGAQCFKDLKAAKKAKFEACLKDKGVTLPAHKAGEHKPEGGEHHGFRGHKDENKALEGCANKQKVRDCKKALFAGSQPTDAQKKQAFDASCAAKKTCKAALGAACEKQLETFKAAASACHDQLESQKDSIRSGVASCAGVTPKPKRGGGASGEKKKGGDKKDYCALGYDAFVADHPKKGAH
jgi:hypothetical protein